MNYKNILKVSLAVVASVALLAGCAKKEEFKEITELSLARCLEPQNLAARVDVATGDKVTFSWDVTKDAQQYLLSIYKDAALTSLEKEIELNPEEIPYTIRLTADQKYWFTVYAYRIDDDGFKVEGSESKVAVFESDGGIKTYAVKDNLYLEVTGRTDSSISLAWSKDVSDYEEVTELSAVPVKGGSTVKKELSAAEKKAAAATIDGLAAGTEYQITLFYMSASRGTVDTWTQAAQGEAVKITSTAELQAAVAAGGNYYLAYSDEAYSMSTAKPVASLTLTGEMAADGSMPAVTGAIDISSVLASGSSIRFENIHFADDGSTGHLVTFSAGPLEMKKIEFVNCEISGFKSGLFYNNKDGGLKIDEIVYDTCFIHDILGSGGDGFDIRKATEITTVKFVNNTIWDGFRTFVRLDAVDAIQIGGFVLENNTIKGVSVVNDSNNQGLFGTKIATSLTLRNNLFLWEDGGVTDEGVDDKTQLVRDNAAIVIPTITASNNYSYANGKDFFKAVSAAEAGCKIMDVDPCYNAKGNFFQLAAQDLIEGKVGASKWWISYVEKPEDLTQNVIKSAHVWNLQNASLFAGNVKNARVRDDLMLVGSEAYPINADGGINFLQASALSKKGVPTEGYISFKVDKPGSVDLLVANGGASSVVVALYDDNGLAVQGGVMTPAGSTVQKVLVPNLTGEGTVYIYATGEISLTKLAWSEDAVGGDMRLATPKVTVDPVTLTEGDETPVSITWEAVDHAASYVVTFNNRKQDPQTETTFTVAAEDIAALKAGLYSFNVRALPEEGDIYYVQSEPGLASFAVQPKGGDAPVEVTNTWDFSAANWVEAFEANFTKINNNEDVTFSVDDLSVVGGGGTLKYNVSGDLYYIQMGGGGNATKRALQFTAPDAGTLKVWVSNTGDSEALDRKVNVAIDGVDIDSQPGGYKKADGPHELEYTITGPGTVAIYGTGGLCFYKVEFTYMSGGTPEIENDWDFSTSNWVTAFETNFTKINNNEDVTFTEDGLTVVGGGGTLKYNVSGDLYYIQMGGGGSATKRALQFTAPAAGTVKVWVSNTGDSEALDRKVNVALDGVDLDSQSGGYKKVDGPHELVFTVTGPGTVAIYGTGGLCFYHVYYINK